MPLFGKKNIENKKDKKQGQEKKAEFQKTQKIEKIKPIVSSKWDDSLKFLISPHITEKSTKISHDNFYVFKINSRANKNQIKKAVETLYNVNVEKVNIINIKRKRKGFGRLEGYKQGYKKAMVKVKKGQKIEIK